MSNAASHMSTPKAHACRVKNSTCTLALPTRHVAIPEKMKEAMGRLGFFRPTRARRMAREMAVTASSWPMTRPCKTCSILISRSVSSDDTFSIGMPVHCATMLAMSCSVTMGPPPSPLSISARWLSLALLVMALIWDFSSISRSRREPAFSKSWALQVAKICGKVRVVNFDKSGVLSGMGWCRADICEKHAQHRVTVIDRLCAIPDSCVLLLQQRTQLLVQLPRLLWQLSMPQPHTGPCLINEINGLKINRRSTT